jgi:C-terminal processing protease CtpA/Prc
MRATALALLLCAPLLAGDRTPLAEAVELFKSPDAAEREAGTQQVKEQLRKLLAPLLAALEDEDPEVRRRARRAILSLVPGELEKEEQRVQPVMQQRALQALARNQEAMAKVFAQRHQRRENQGAANLAALGITGESFRQAPLQPGFLVRTVKPGSLAERLGLKCSDLIVSVNRRATSRPGDFASIKDWKRARILVKRGKKRLYLPARKARK